MPSIDPGANPLSISSTKSEPSPGASFTQHPDLHKSRDTGPPAGCRVRHCAGTTIRHRKATRTMALPGSLGYRLEVYSPGYEGGRRSRDQRGQRPSRYHRTTTLIARRWVARGGQEGRSRQHPVTESVSATLTATETVSVAVAGILRARRPHHNRSPHNRSIPNPRLIHPQLRGVMRCASALNCDAAMAQKCDGLCDVLCVLGALRGETAMAAVSSRTSRLGGSIVRRPYISSGIGIPRSSSSSTCISSTKRVKTARRSARSFSSSSGTTGFEW